MKPGNLLVLTCLFVTSLASGTSRADTIWGIKSNTIAGDPSLNPAALFYLETDGSFWIIGPIELAGAEIDADGLALSNEHGLLAFELQDPLQFVPSASRLVRLDPLTGEATPIGPALIGREIRGAVFGPNERLWVVDSIADELLEIDPTSGTIVGTPIALDIQLSNVTDLALATDGSYILSDLTFIYGLDISTGVTQQLFEDTELHDDHPVGYAGLAFSTEDDFDLHAYDVTWYDDIFQFPDASFAPRVLTYPNIMNWFNAGRGDLASAMTTPVGVDDFVPQFGIQLHSYPNPFNPNVALEYVLTQRVFIEMTIHDLRGRHIRTLEEGQRGPGTHVVMWDGRDSSGAAVPSGTYLARVRAGDTQVTRKVILLK